MLERWWTYQRERFPVVGHGVLILAFSLSAVCYSCLLRTDDEWPTLAGAVVAFVTSFLFFLQLRIADEFKDFEEDARYRPYRPVQRGLVTLRELGFLGAGTALIQLALGLWLSPTLALWLGVVWVYLVLMSQEFFVGNWLRARHVLYMLSHMVIVPLIDFYATACDWAPMPRGRGLVIAGQPPEGLFWFVAVSYFNGMVIEIGRKVRSPADEEEGVNTYSRLWGPGGAVLAWLGAMAAAACCAVMAAGAIGFLVPVSVWLGALLCAAALIGWAFLRDQAPGRGKRIEALSAVWTIGMYLAIGAAPLLWRQLATRGPDSP